MAAEKIKEARKSMFKRVCMWTLEHQAHFNLVKEFSERTAWLTRPIFTREAGQVKGLDVFLHALEMEPQKEDINSFLDFLKRNEGQPRAVRALNAIEEIEGREGHWTDNSKPYPLSV
jgi:hypothetical protein